MYPINPFLPEKLPQSSHINIHFSDAVKSNDIHEAISTTTQYLINKTIKNVNIDTYLNTINCLKPIEIAQIIEIHKQTLLQILWNIGILKTKTSIVPLEHNLDNYLKIYQGTYHDEKCKMTFSLKLAIKLHIRTALANHYNIISATLKYQNKLIVQN